MCYTCTTKSPNYLGGKYLLLRPRGPVDRMFIVVTLTTVPRYLDPDPRTSGTTEDLSVRKTPPLNLLGG